MDGMAGFLQIFREDRHQRKPRAFFWGMAVLRMERGFAFFARTC